MNGMNVRELVEQLKDAYVPTEGTYKLWLKSIKQIQHLEPEQVGKKEAFQYRVYGKKNWTDNTLITRIGYLKAIWRKAYKWELIEGNDSQNPWLAADDGLDEIHRTPKLRPYSFYSYYHNDPYFQCLWYSGMRIGELAGIYPENIVTSTEIPYFNLVHQKNRRLKNDSSIRRVPIHPACMPFLDKLYFSKAKSPGASWSENFRRNNGLPKGEGAHSLRHSFTTRMRLAGCDTPTLKRLLGHGFKDRIEKYGEFPLELLHKEITKLDKD